MHPEASESIQNYFPSWFLTHVRIFPCTDLKRPGHCQGAELEGPLCPTCLLTPSGKPLLAQGGRSISVGAVAGYSWLLLASRCSFWSLSAQLAMETQRNEKVHLSHLVRKKAGQSPS